ncbi:hypothetical protein CRUP_007379 [Coryphaenoides rupestris]|nr:hypothetical protein CRUP_007379 [Coryphaenoides rupestris]
MSSSEFLYNLPAGVLCDFCRLMDGLAETHWVRFGGAKLDSRLPPRPRSPMDPAPKRPQNVSPLPTLTPTQGPPPSSLQSGGQPLIKAPAECVCETVAMCWSHDEVEKGTNGFSPSQLVGEGGFGAVYQAYMRNTEYAVKRLKQVQTPQRVGADGVHFLHIPIHPPRPLIHGDVKSSNILLDQHLVPKLGDFGLAVFSPAREGVRTTCVGKTTSLRGTQAYLPLDYLQDGHMTTSLDVYSFGVKDLLADLEEAPSLAQSCATHLDARLRNTSSPGGVTGCVDVAALACKCLHRNRKKRPAMTKVFEKLQDLLNLLRSNPSPPSSLHSHPPSIPTQDEVRQDSLVWDIAQLGIQGHSSCSSISSSSSSSSIFTSSLSQPCEDLYSVCYGPEESDELDFLPN